MTNKIEIIILYCCSFTPETSKPEVFHTLYPATSWLLESLNPLFYQLRFGQLLHNGLGKILDMFAYLSIGRGI